MHNCNSIMRFRIENILSPVGIGFLVGFMQFAPLSVGEESGQLDELVGEVSLHYQDELDYELERLSARIEPILIVCLSAMVAVLALGIFMPIWNLYAMQLAGG